MQRGTKTVSELLFQVGDNGRTLRASMASGGGVPWHRRGWPFPAGSAREYVQCDRFPGSRSA